MKEEQEISFLIYLTDQDWDNAANGWRCPLLKIPGAEIERILENGRDVQRYEYQVDRKLEMILLSPNSSRPNLLTVVIRFTKNLSTQEATDTWKKLAFFLPLIAAIITAILPELTKVWLGNKDYSNTTPAPSEVVTTVVTTPTLTPTPPPVSTPTPTSTPTLVNKYKERYANNNDEFPLPQCGEVVGRPVYPIFVPNEGNNLARVRAEFCKDAYSIRGDAYYPRGKVVVASFSNEEEANIFLEFIKEYFDGARKGQPQ